MNRIKALTQNETFRACMQGIFEEERNRPYCLHGFEHSLDVARISYIINLEKNLGYEKDVVYAMALLHDIGRWEEYSNGASHHERSAQLAAGILEACGFEEAERSAICHAIENHKQNDGQTKDLSYLLFRADKLSRTCFNCAAAESCYWSDEQKNREIII